MIKQNISFNGTVGNEENSSDYKFLKSYQNEQRLDHVIFLLHYLITIPLILLVVSKFIRCLRNRGMISGSSEQCMFNEYNRRLNTVTLSQSPSSTHI